MGVVDSHMGIVDSLMGVVDSLVVSNSKNLFKVSWFQTPKIFLKKFSNSTKNVLSPNKFQSPKKIVWGWGRHPPPHHMTAPLPQHIGIIDSHVGVVDTQKYEKTAEKC